MALFAFIYWQTTKAETSRIESELMTELARLAEFEDTTLQSVLEQRLSLAFHRLNYAALFSATGDPIAGNLLKIPGPLDGSVQARRFELSSGDSVLMAERRLADGRLLVVGRSIDSLENLRAVVIHALALAMAPAVAFGLLSGVILSQQTHARIKMLNRATQRILQGHLHERLPIKGTDQDLDRLSGGVNSMLDVIERLLEEAASVGDNIAHDLRTPLTRVRARLERAQERARTQGDVADLIDQAIVGLDHALRIITALLRIGHMERTPQRAGFTTVDLGRVVGEITDLFTPVAEDKAIAFTASPAPAPPVHGDPDLLIEAVANLVDNALKFTPPGGKVTLALSDEDGATVIRVTDTGPGIRQEDMDRIMRRFYRSDKSRHIEGNGLGLSIVGAIARLHGFSLTFRNLEQGCVFELRCAHADDLDPQPRPAVT